MEPAMAAPNAMAGQFALHLASYRQRENALAGWDEIRAAVPNQLSDLRPGTSLFDKGADGQFVRLKAGPLASKAEAEARCKSHTGRRPVLRGDAVSGNLAPVGRYSPYAGQTASNSGTATTMIRICSGRPIRQ